MLFLCYLVSAIKCRTWNYRKHYSGTKTTIQIKQKRAVVSHQWGLLSGVPLCQYQNNQPEDLKLCFIMTSSVHSLHKNHISHGQQDRCLKGPSQNHKWWHITVSLMTHHMTDMVGKTGVWRDHLKIASDVYDLVPKGAHSRGYALQLKIKHCWKLFLFKMLCCVLVWMNEYIVQIISATRLWLISRYSHHTLKKRWKMTAKNGHPCTEWFSSLYLQTNRKHMENQSLICTRKTSFYPDNITSSLMIVVFLINWSQMFAL